MNLGLNVFRNTLARRVFVLFVVCAGIPFVSVSLIAHSYVTDRLSRQSEERLRDSAKDLSLAVYERLLVVEGDLKIIDHALGRWRGPEPSADGVGFRENLEDRMIAVALITSDGAVEVVAGSTEWAAEFSKLPFSEVQLESLNRDRTALTTVRTDTGDPALVMARRSEFGGGGGLLVTIIRPAFLVGIVDDEETVDGVASVVVAPDGGVLFSNLPGSDDLRTALLPRLTHAHSDHLQVTLNGRVHLVGYWNLFLRPRFGSTSVTVIRAEPRSVVLAPIAGFRAAFPLAVVATLGIVLLASIRAIRLRMAPVDALRTAAAAIAEERFDHRVEIRSGDEFQELAASFNHMAGRLERQFAALETRGDIDRAILSSLDARDVVRTVVSRATDLFGSDRTVLVLFDSEIPSRATLVSHGPVGAQDPVVSDAEFRPSDLEVFRQNPSQVLLGVNGLPVPRALSSVAGGDHQVIGYPVVLDDRLAAVLVFWRKPCAALPESERVAARQMADQLGVALSNSGLVAELRRVNLETITAFARAVDAKSSWTAGHSTRVTDLTLHIGNEMGLAPGALERLRRGALLHDLGKIGVSTSILDKAGRLTAGEREQIQAHSEIGARILEPISGLRDVLPMVAQHHERFDGSGYPNGLSGSSIDFDARILAVADVFDAMTSDRPYRRGVAADKVLRMLEEQAGVLFDRQVVNAFLCVAESGVIPVVNRASDAVRQDGNVVDIGGTG